MNTPIFDDKQFKSDDPTQAFRVPDGYFDRLHASIKSRIEAEEEEEQAAPADRSLMDILRPYLYLAAMFVGLTLIINLIPYVDRMAGKESTPAMAVSQPTQEEIEIADEYYEQFLWEETADEFIASSLSDSH